MMTCEECGSLVDPSDEMLKRHADWHEKLVTKDDLTHSALADPRRSRLLGDISILDC